MNRLPTVAARNTIAMNENGLRVKGTSKATRQVKTTREALSNITNQANGRVGTIKAPTKLPSKAAVKPTKRPTEPETHEPEYQPEQKKRKSTEPMAIDDEDAMSTGSDSLAPPETQAWENIDEGDQDDAQSVVEFVNDIYECLMIKERESRISPRYMSIQVDVNEKMRAILIDWLVEVHRMFKLLPETLFLTVNVIDRYLEKTAVARDRLQLVGITAMLIGAKYEEIYAPECNDFVYISDNAYTKDQILKMETEILNTLQFNLTTPSALHFLRRYSKAAGSDYTIHTLCKYLIELVLIDIKLLRFLPSEIAAGSVYLARMMMHKTPYWTPTLTHYSTYDEGHAAMVATEINALLKKAQKSSLKAIQKKYSLEKFGQVAEIPLVDL